MSWEDSDREKKVLADRAKAGGDFAEIVRIVFPVGKTTVRLLSNPPKFAMTHWMKLVKRDVVCPKTTDEFTECLVCATGDKSKVRYFANLIDRRDGKVKLWSFPRKVKEYIAALDDAFGDPTLYDVVVTRIGESLETDWIVTPANKGQETPLTEEEMELVKKATDLNQLYKVTPVDKVKLYLAGKLPEKKSRNGKTATVRAVHTDPVPDATEATEAFPDPDPLEDDKPF